MRGLAGVIGVGGAVSWYDAPSPQRQILPHTVKLAVGTIGIVTFPKPFLAVDRGHGVCYCPKKPSRQFVATILLG